MATSALNLDSITLRNIAKVSEYVRKRDWDWLIVCDGDERIGKSTVSAGLLLAAEPEVERDIECGIYETALSKMAWDFDSMLTLMKELPDGTAQMYDEASILGREAMKEHNLRMVRVMTTVGHRNRIYIWTFPDFYMLDPYLRDGRVRTRGFVYTTEAERGYVVWYARQRFPFPRPGGETVWWNMGYKGRFRSIPSISENHAEFWALYAERDTAAKTKILEGALPDARKEIALRLSEMGQSIRAVAKIVNRSPGTVSAWVKRARDAGLIPPAGHAPKDS